MSKRWTFGEFAELRKKKFPERCEPKVQGKGNGKTRRAGKRRARRNMKMRDDLKLEGRHRGFSHGKA